MDGVRSTNGPGSLHHWSACRPPLDLASSVNGLSSVLVGLGTVPGGRTRSSEHAAPCLTTQAAGGPLPTHFRTFQHLLHVRAASHSGSLRHSPIQSDRPHFLALYTTLPSPQGSFTFRLFASLSHRVRAISFFSSLLHYPIESEQPHFSTLRVTIPSSQRALTFQLFALLSHRIRLSSPPTTSNIWEIYLISK